MKLVRTIAECRSERKGLKEPVGFVPTMGALHEGHLSLVRLARSRDSSVVVSVFLNPAQFGPGEDLAAYPRDLEGDLALLEKEGVDLVFAPAAEELYPQSFSTWVEVEGVSQRLEGASRPGHFRGVATVVAKLLNVVEPDRMYLGQKDAQQVVVLKRAVADLDVHTEVMVGPTVRERDGLAMSSRNRYLSPTERKAASVLYRALRAAERLWQEGERGGDRLRGEMTRVIEREPLARIDYVSVADAETLEELDRVDRPALASLAVRIGKTRLIDNVLLPGPKEEE